MGKPLVQLPWGPLSSIWPDGWKDGSEIEIDIHIIPAPIRRPVYVASSSVSGGLSFQAGSFQYGEYQSADSRDDMIFCNVSFGDWDAFASLG